MAMMPNRETALNVAGLLLSVGRPAAPETLRIVLFSIRDALVRQGWHPLDACEFACDFGDLVVDELEAMASRVLH